MQDDYRVTTLLLTLLLLPSFAYLYHRYRNTRTLLWLLGFLFASVHMIAKLSIVQLGSDRHLHPWLFAFTAITVQASSAMFLASLTPKRIHLGRLRLLYVFILPVIAVSLLVESTLAGVTSTALLGWAFPVLGTISAIAALRWGWKNGSAPAWLGTSICAAALLASGWYYHLFGPASSLYAVDSGIHFITALFVLSVFRRFSPGVILTAAGFIGWSLMLPDLFPYLHLTPAIFLIGFRVIVMAKLVAAMGMILLTLEDELDAKKAAQERERRMRLEMEAYANLIYSHHKVAEFDGRATEICQAVTEHSRFSQAGLLLIDGFGRYRLAGAAGFDPAVKAALGTLVAKIAVPGFLTRGSAPPVVERSATVRLDLKPWLQPGNDLIRLHCSEVLAIPLAGRSAIDGALILAGMRHIRSQAPASTGSLPDLEDLLPLEMFARGWSRCAVRPSCWRS